MKNLTRREWIILVLALQLLALGSIVAKREWIHGNGEIVYLRTAPVDPRDMFRGDYVQLEYEISQPDATLMQQEWLQPEKQQKQKSLPVYLQLQRDQHGIAGLTGIRQEKPDGLFIKGRIDSQWRSWNRNSFIQLGIEKFFVEQGAGLALEKARGRGQEWQTPLEMEVALGNDGTAVIRGHRWSELGVRLEVLESGRIPDTGMQNASATTTSDLLDRQSAKLRISVRNQSKNPMLFIDSANHCAFSLAENEFQPSGLGQMLMTMKMPNRPCNEAVEWEEKLLQAGEIHTFEIDLAEPQWHVTADGKTQELGTLQNRWQGFRFIYQLPESERKARAGRTGVWLSSLRTTRFMASGRID